MDLYPLQFEPIYKEKVWGGRTLEQLGRTLPGDAATLIGESWELSDLASTSPTGGGGDAARSVIRNGPLAGTTLHDAIARFGDELMGKLQPTDDGDFPLLVKFLDARENLSVQVHPGSQYADQHDDAHLKCEAWYIIDAEPGSVIYKGIRNGVAPDEFRHALDTNDPAAVTELLITIPAKKGACHYLPSGTCHALGAGVLVAEAQTPSDTTFRVFDWGRTDRELHIDQAMQCIDFGPPNVSEQEKRSHIAGVHTTVSRLCLCDYFRIERIRMTESYEQEIPYDQPAIWMVLEGGGSINPGGDAPIVKFEKGQSMLLPASMKDAHVKINEDTVWLEITFPQALEELIA